MSSGVAEALERRAMTQRLRFLLDTNVLIPLQDSYQVLEANLANFVRLAGVGGHQLLYHPATVADFERDANTERRGRNLQRIRQYAALQQPAPCPWNAHTTSANDACDNEILYALECDAVHALVTEDRGIHAKASARKEVVTWTVRCLLALLLLGLAVRLGFGGLLQ